jgi:acyl-CoA thioester hydrolase
MSKLLEPPEGRKVFTLQFQPTPADIDENGHVNNVVYLRWAQDLGVAHWQSLAPAAAQATWAWVALRHEIDYRRALLPGETGHGRTWVSDQTEGPRFDRFIRIDADDGALGGVMCAQVKTTWVLIEQATGKPKRVPPWMLELFA